MDHGVAYIL